jgi:hypothetical protein
VNPGAGDELFTITADPTAIILTFDEGVTENELAVTGFFLSDVKNTDNLPIEIVDVQYFGDFSSLPVTDPTVSNCSGRDQFERNQLESGWCGPGRC